MSDDTPTHPGPPIVGDLVIIARGGKVYSRIVTQVGDNLASTVGWTKADWPAAPTTPVRFVGGTGGPLVSDNLVRQLQEGRIGESGMLTSNDPEPGSGTRVADASGLTWERQPEGYWVRPDLDDGEAESWTKVAGNYGPVRLVGASVTDRIRERLDRPFDGRMDQEPYEFAVAIRQAIDAVLELHHADHPDEGRACCAECTDERAVPYPCPTVLTIALGIGLGATRPPT